MDVCVCVKKKSKKLDDMEMKGGRHLKVNISVPNLRLFVGNIPKSKGKSEIYEEFSKVTGKVAHLFISLQNSPLVFIFNHWGSISLLDTLLPFSLSLSVSLFL